jgi:hypothetical protein
MEQAQGMSQGQDTNVSQPAPSQTSSAPAPQASEERTFRQNEVSDLVRRAKSEAVESYRRQQQEQPQYVAQKYGDQQQPAMQQPTESPDDKIRRLASEAAQSQIEKVRQDYLQKSQDEMAQRTVQNFTNKVLAAKDKYQDFDKVVPGNDLLSQYPNVVQLLGDYVDNSGDILYHLGQDLTRLELLESMANRSPQAAIKQVQRLSQSLKDNESAGKVKLPNEPLSQMRPSNTGTDTGAMSVGDYRKKYRV